MEKFIHITVSDREFLSKVFNCTKRMVYDAIHFRSETELARKIRKVALERGGIIMALSPVVETLHDADGYIRQYFPNGVLLELRKADGTGVVLKEGEAVKCFENITLSTIEQAQAFAAAL